MPPWSVRFQRTAFAWLLVGAGAGALMLAAKGLGWTLPYGEATTFHADVMLFGWMTQFTMGTAYWMLPKHASGPERGSGAPMLTAWVLLNVGTALAGLGRSPSLITVGRLAEFAAVVAFARNAIPRIKPFGTGRPAV